MDAPLKSMVNFLVKAIPCDAKFMSPGTLDSFAQPNHLNMYEISHPELEWTPTLFEVSAAHW